MGTDSLDPFEDTALLRYQYVATEISKQIDSQLFIPGQKIPGTRLLAERFGVSINTVLQAQKHLELQGLIESVPRSGFFVRYSEQSRNKVKTPPVAKFKVRPTLVAKQRLVMDLINASLRDDLVQLGAALPGNDFLPLDDIRKAMSRAVRLKPEAMINYAFPPGNLGLRQELSKKMKSIGCEVSHDEIVITSGCHEAVVLALKALTQPGDIILLESPTFYGLLQAVESLKLKALEIPADSHNGIDIAALEAACKRWNAKACILVSNFSNPLGSCASPATKAAIVNILNENDIPLIEDDIYGDLAFDGHRPPPMKSFDRDGKVIYCSSFSKTVAPGLRTGWIAPGQYYEEINYLKFTQSLGAASMEQLALAQYLKEGSYPRHIRRLQRLCSNQVNRTRELILNNAPAGTLCSQPAGGFVLWIELPKCYHTGTLYELALAEKISIAPGSVFTGSDAYNHCFRINCAQPWSEEYEKALLTVCGLIEKSKQPESN
ncbi:MAG: DNA-binding transcriptional MocR family regulator [Flavobacteriales bacterium]|jgi:DNA-binding transcriptional MocR family regulator